MEYQMYNSYAWLHPVFDNDSNYIRNNGGGFL
uniref:Uncharacterized protein n=1 Tax=Escherichia coli TaxID=562 RepID=A0A343J0T5_ECOLX|nr:hypothetical protein ECSA44_05760 [Escherichia coli]